MSESKPVNLGTPEAREDGKTPFEALGATFDELVEKGLLVGEVHEEIPARRQHIDYSDLSVKGSVSKVFKLPSTSKTVRLIQWDEQLTSTFSKYSEGHQITYELRAVPDDTQKITYYPRRTEDEILLISSTMGPARGRKKEDGDEVVGLTKRHVKVDDDAAFNLIKDVEVAIASPEQWFGDK